MEVSVKEAINCGAWLESRGIRNQVHHFRIRVKALERFGLERLVGLLRKFSFVPDRLERLLAEDGVLWLLAIEVVNLRKRGVSPDALRERLVLIDQDGFQFEALELSMADQHDIPVLKGLYRFSSGADPLRPKIRAEGIVPFFLPDDDAADYFLMCVGGRLREV